MSSVQFLGAVKGARLPTGEPFSECDLPDMEGQRISFLIPHTHHRWKCGVVIFKSVGRGQNQYAYVHYRHKRCGVRDKYLGPVYRKVDTK